MCYISLILSTVPLEITLTCVEVIEGGGGVDGRGRGDGDGRGKGGHENTTRISTSIDTTSVSCPLLYHDYFYLTVNSSGHYCIFLPYCRLGNTDYFLYHHTNQTRFDYPNPSLV